MTGVGLKRGAISASANFASAAAAIAAAHWPGWLTLSA